MKKCLFLFFLFLAGCVSIEPVSNSKAYIQPYAEAEPQTLIQDANKVSITKDVPAINHLGITDNSNIIKHTLQFDAVVVNTADEGVILTRICTKLYDYFDNLIKEDVWFMVVPIAPGKEKHLKRNIYTEPTQSKIPKSFFVRICGAEYGEGGGS